MEEIRMILCGEVEEADGTSEKTGVVSVVYVSKDLQRIKAKLVELQERNPDKFYMDYLVPLDADLTALEHYPSIEISREDLE
ncbi:hypothetical protein D6853_09575 [Butyrivibrio sp. X503]|uniref:hypothetical protein n=1 Tax=Butyrivibrio sp. X503 TaxID=2364878 RepID=UPI000EA8772E|nr:hypothetical protein [Butyrivibrio sp. X503]RKM55785.1 hypothetical protein D6853_09575 [Butyrivibrio sp. X503]